MLKYIFTKYLHVYPNTTYFIITCIKRGQFIFTPLRVSTKSETPFPKKTSSEQMHPPQIQKVKQVEQIK